MFHRGNFREAGVLQKQEAHNHQMEDIMVNGLQSSGETTRLTDFIGFAWAHRPSWPARIVWGSD
jgi:hypothetical protein